MSVYKQFLPNDYAVVPFNAHKQYEFDSTSSLSSSITFTNTKYSQLSIDNYDSSSNLTNNPDGFDNIKYSQIDHLFYRNYLTDLSNKFGDIDYLKHNRTLYEKCTILSIPSGLYGHKIKPGSLEFKGGPYTFVDDSYGNLIPKGTNINDFITDPRLILVNLGPVNGFKRYDLNIHNNFIENIYYKKGQPRVNTITSYSTPSDKYEYDDSYFLNKIYYKNVNFFELTHFLQSYPVIDFNGINSEIKLYHDPKFNFNHGDDFAIEFWVKIENNDLTNEVHLIGKSKTKTVVKSPLEGSSGIYPLLYTGSSQPQDVNGGSQYPFEIYVKNNTDSSPSIFFRKSDGETTISVQNTITTGSIQHIICQAVNNRLFIYKNGSISSIGSRESLKNPTQNQANIYIGNRGGNSNYLKGSLSQIKIYNTSLNDTQVNSHYKSNIGSPYIGNIFYSNGLIVIPKQNTQQGVGTVAVESSLIVGASEVNDNILQKIQFQGSHLIYENEYKCTINEYEYNTTLNPSARKSKSNENSDLANFATSSLFKPYITTVGLYNDNNELLVVGKLGQPLRKSDETDTTIVLRWDT